MEVPPGSFVDIVEGGFSRLAGWSVDRRPIVILIALLFLSLGLFYASKVRVDNSLDSYFNKSDEAYIAYVEYLDEFLSDEVAYILYRVPDREYGPFDLGAMRKIANLTRALERETPFVRKVTSLANVEVIRASGDEITVDELLLEFPESQNALLEIRDLVMTRPLYVGYVIDETARYAAIILEMSRSAADPLDTIIYDREIGATNPDNLYPQATQLVVEKILARPEYEGIEFFASGDVPMNSAYSKIFREDSVTGTLITLTAITLLSMFMMRVGLTTLLGPLIVVVLSLVMVTAVMGMFGWVIGMFFGIVPTLICAVGVAQSVHILLAYKRAQAVCVTRREAVKEALAKVGNPCLLASMTTSVGLLVMVVSELRVLSEMAMYSAAGIMFTFILSATLLVSVLAGGKEKPFKRRSQPVIRASVSRMVDACISLNLRRPRLLLTLGGVTIAIALLGVIRLETDSNFLKDFKPHVPVRQHTEEIERIMGGLYSIVYIVDAAQGRDVRDPGLLHAIDRFQRFAEEQPLVKNSQSIADIQKELNRSFHGDEPGMYRIPDNKDLVSQYFLVYEMSGGDRLEDFVSQEYRRTVIKLNVEITDSSKVAELLRTLDDFLAEHPIEGVTIRKTGSGLMWVTISQYIASTQVLGYSLLFGMIALFLCFAFGSIKVGLLAMIPNLLPVLVVLGFMGWANISLDYLKLLLATIAISIAVDDTIHLTVAFRKAFLRSGSYKVALRESMEYVGPALLVTTAILVGAFSCYLFSDLASISQFGLLLSIAIVVALVADLLFMPALLVATKPFGKEVTQPD